MRRMLTIAIWLVAAGLTAGLVWGLTVGWRPWEFADIYARPDELRVEWSRDFDASMREFVDRLAEGEPFTFTLSENAINGLLSERLEEAMAEHLRSDLGIREPQISCQEGRIVFMLRYDPAGGAVVSADIGVSADGAGRCRFTVTGVRIGSVPMDAAFVREKAEAIFSVARRYEGYSRNVARRDPHSWRVVSYRRTAEAYRALASAIGGKPLPAAGHVGEGLDFVIDGVVLRRGSVGLHVQPRGGSSG